MIDISSYFGSLAGAAGLVVILTGYINTKTKATGFVAQLVSWLVAFGVAFVGQQKAIGVFADTNILWTAINGLAVGLIANGMFSIDLIQSVLVFIKAKKAPTTPVAV